MRKRWRGGTAARQTWYPSIRHARLSRSTSGASDLGGGEPRCAQALVAGDVTVEQCELGEDAPRAAERRGTSPNCPVGPRTGTAWRSCLPRSGREVGGQGGDGVQLVPGRARRPRPRAFARSSSKVSASRGCALGAKSSARAPPESLGPRQRARRGSPSLVDAAQNQDIRYDHALNGHGSCPRGLHSLV